MSYMHFSSSQPVMHISLEDITTVSECPSTTKQRFALHSTQLEFRLPNSLTGDGTEMSTHAGTASAFLVLCCKKLAG